MDVGELICLIGQGSIAVIIAGQVSILPRQHPISTTTIHRCSYLIIYEPWAKPPIYPVDNTMVLLVTTTHIISALEAVPPSSRKELDLPDSLSINSPISHEQVIRLSHYFRNGGSSTSPDPNPDRSLNSLLRGTKVYIPPPPKKPEPVRPTHLSLPVHQVLTNMITRVPSTSP